MVSGLFSTPWKENIFIRRNGLPISMSLTVSRVRVFTKQAIFDFFSLVFFDGDLKLVDCRSPAHLGGH